jgi:cation diffusion facilitator family transporter
MNPPTKAERARSTRAVTTASVSVAAILVAVKAIVWWLSGSVTLLASMADSGLDLIASSATFFAVRYAQAPPDKEHRFGHGKAEAFASLMQAGLVFASAAVIGEEAVRHLVRPHPLQREGWAIAVMAFSLVLTGALVTFQGQVLRRADSVAVSGDRAHYAADFVSNLAALAAIAAATLIGWTGFDALGGLAVAAVLLWGAVAVFRQASNQLLDHELPDKDRKRIIALMTEDTAVSAVRQLRTRASGPIVHIQVHADLDPEMSLEAAHKVVLAAERRVLKAFPQADILIHPDPRGRAEPHSGSFAEASADVET